MLTGLFSRYCSRTCQKVDWRFHGRNCLLARRELEDESARTRAPSSDVLICSASDLGLLLRIIERMACGEAGIL